MDLQYGEKEHSRSKVLASDVGFGNKLHKLASPSIPYNLRDRNTEIYSTCRSMDVLRSWRGNRSPILNIISSIVQLGMHESFTSGRPHQIVATLTTEALICEQCIYWRRDPTLVVDSRGRFQELSFECRIYCRILSIPNCTVVIRPPHCIYVSLITIA